MGVAFTIVLALCGNPPAVDYLQDVKPILHHRCVQCHGSLKQESGLRLDASAGWRHGGERGPAVKPGKSKDSTLVQAITGAGDLKMPPDGQPLSASQIELIKRWIDGGAKAPDEQLPPDPRAHWAFRKPVLRKAPQAAVGTHPIDAFLNAARREKGVSSQPPTDKHSLLRRVSLDLVGLPPTVAEIEAFVADQRPNAYERVVDRLLASPAYGERWGRHWMDVWRYSDWTGWTDGKQIRDSQPHIWRWRDWIVGSLNRDKPYDRMILEMLAGDELDPDDDECLAGTGFLVRNYKMLSRETWMQDVVEHTSKAFLGLTMNCARCHDHMYDPIRQVDYYNLRAVFEPHQVRLERLPSQSDTGKDALPRVYDANLGAQTFFFARGDDRQPVKDIAIHPGVPAFLGGKLDIKPVSLTVRAIQPALRDFESNDTLAGLEQAIVKARQAVAAASSSKPTVVQATAHKATATNAATNATGIKAPVAKSATAATAPGGIDAKEKPIPKTGGVPVDAVAIAKQRLVVSLSAKEDFLARRTADRVKRGLESAGSLGVMAWRAAAAESRGRRDRAQLKVLEAQAALDRLRSAAKPDAAKATKAETALAHAKKEHDQAEAGGKRFTPIHAGGPRQELAKLLAQPAPAYTSVGAVYPERSSGNRLALARWLASRDNPLTARVAVNHVWRRHFGQALAPTMFDFGRAGRRPMHPELLDWLAVQFMEQDWRLKPLHRLIVTSAAYRMSSAPAAAALKVDPDNQTYWRMSPRRMEAELVRDVVLAVSSQLDRTLGGPELPYEQGLTSARRSLYFRHAPEKQMTFLRVFDAAPPTECYERRESIVPQQALALANSELAAKAAKQLGTSLARGKEPTEFVRAAFVQILNRPAASSEQQDAVEFLNQQTLVFRKTAKPQPTPAPDAAALRARESLALVLLNHHELVTIP